MYYTVLTFISLIICWNSVPITPPSRSKFISIVEIGAAAGWLRFVEQLELDQNRFGRLGLFIICQIYTDSAANSSMRLNRCKSIHWPGFCFNYICFFNRKTQIVTIHFLCEIRSICTMGFCFNFTKCRCFAVVRWESIGAAALSQNWTHRYKREKTSCT